MTSEQIQLTLLAVNICLVAFVGYALFQQRKA